MFTIRWRAIISGIVLSGSVAAGLVIAQSPQEAGVTPAQAASELYRANQAWRRRQTTLSSITGQSDDLSAYAQKCDAATEITVPAFSCDEGTEVPGQGHVPSTGRNSTTCDNPNVLNGQCDPGSRFQVLRGRTADAVAVAHCRKVGLPIEGSLYNDIAVIQYNKKNGAICFYQALTNLPGQHVPRPMDGEGAWQPGSTASWISPREVERSISCTGCHDNGGFIRSRYLAQLTSLPNALPGSAAGFNNFDTPAKYVGLNYATNRSWSIVAPPAPGDAGLRCTTCHRLAVPNQRVNGNINGTAAHFARIATAGSQDSKNPHSPASPIWMRPGQITHRAETEASARIFEACATGFFNSGFVSAPPGCVVTPLGVPWDGKKETSLVHIYYGLGI